MWAMPADASVCPLFDGIEWVDVLWQDPDLDHVTGFPVAAVEGGDADDGTPIERALAFVQNKTLWARHGGRVIQVSQQ